MVRGSVETDDDGGLDGLNVSFNCPAPPRPAPGAQGTGAGSKKPGERFAATPGLMLRGTTAGLLALTERGGPHPMHSVSARA